MIDEIIGFLWLILPAKTRSMPSVRAFGSLRMGMSMSNDKDFGATDCISLNESFVRVYLCIRSSKIDHKKYYRKILICFQEVYVRETLRIMWE